MRESVTARTVEGERRETGTEVYVSPARQISRRECATRWKS